MKIKTSKGDRTFQVINILIFAIFAIICAYPFYYLIINSISANDLSASGKVNFLPHGFQLENYVKVFQLNGLGTAAMVSLGRTVIGTICTVLASVYLGFMFTQQRMWHRKLWYRFMVITMYFNAGLIPMYMTMKTLHLTNSFWVYIIPAIVQPFNIIMAKTYVESIPPALQEAAEIDGATHMQTLFKVKIPMVMPSITICIFLTLSNSFKLFDQNLSLTAGEPSKMSEMMALNIFNTFYGRTGWEGVGQAKAVLFFVLVVAISMIQLHMTRSKEVQQ